MAGPSLRQAAGAAAGDGRLSKADQIHQALKQAITKGEVPPGTAIDKAALCVRFGVSRLPVTTAINRLAYEGLVLIEPQRGSYVSRIRLGDVVQWMMARRAIEADIAAEAARRLPEGVREAMVRNLRYQEAAVTSRGLRRLSRPRCGFHQLLTDGLGLPRVAETLDALRVHLDRVRRLLLPEPGRMAATLAEHLAMLEAIAAGKPASPTAPCAGTSRPSSTASSLSRTSTPTSSDRRAMRRPARMRPAPEARGIRRPIHLGPDLSPNPRAWSGQLGFLTPQVGRPLRKRGGPRPTLGGRRRSAAGLHFMATPCTTLFVAPR